MEYPVCPWEGFWNRTGTETPEKELTQHKDPMTNLEMVERFPSNLGGATDLTVIQEASEGFSTK